MIIAARERNTRKKIDTEPPTAEDGRVVEEGRWSLRLRLDFFTTRRKETAIEQVWKKAKERRLGEQEADYVRYA